MAGSERGRWTGDRAGPRRGYPGVAFTVRGHVQQVDTDGETYDDPDWVAVVMVGDDRRIEVEAADVSPLDTEKYCAGCGQIGCEWEVGHVTLLDMLAEMTRFRGRPLVSRQSTHSPSGLARSAGVRSSRHTWQGAPRTSYSAARS